MPPYEKKCLQRIFDTTGLSDTKLVDMITAWLSDTIADTHFNDVLHKWEKKEESSVPHSCCNCKYGGLKLSKEPCKSCDRSFCNWEVVK